jgi:hypothetical protein
MVIDTTALNAAWDNAFHVPPIGHLLRDACSERWVRFYSLPNGKRYPTSDAEYAELLSRHNQIAETLFGDACSLVLVTTVVDKSPTPPAVNRGRHWQSPHLGPHDPESAYYHVYVEPIVWRSGTLDPLLREVAEWKRVNLMVWNVGRGELFAPYDGGVDVILRSAAARDHFRATFLPWASPQPTGL